MSRLRSGRRVFDYLVLAGVVAGIIVVTRYLDIPEIDGPVVVVDGDSLRLNGSKVRLHGIDAPELDQSCLLANGKSYRCGRDAKNHLRRLIAKRNVDCDITDVDRYGRDVAICKAGETKLNITMVKDGWAVAYLRYSHSYAQVEKQARNAKRGIWRGDFEEPEDWRARRRNKPRGKSYY